MASTTSVGTSTYVKSIWQMLLITALLAALKIYMIKVASLQVELLSVCVGVVFLGLLSFRLYNIYSSETHTLWNFLIKFCVFSLIFGGTILMILPYEEAQLTGFFWSFVATTFIGTLSQMGQQGGKDDSPFFSFFILLFVGFYIFIGMVVRLYDWELLSPEGGLSYLIPAAKTLPLKTVRFIQMLLLIPNVAMLGFQLIQKGLFDKIIESLAISVRPVKDMKTEGMWLFINSLPYRTGTENTFNIWITVINVLIWIINLVIRLIVFVVMAVGNIIQTFYEVLLPKIKQWGKLVSFVLIGVITLFIPWFAITLGLSFYENFNKSWNDVGVGALYFIAVCVIFFVVTFGVRLFLLLAFQSEKYAVKKMLGDVWKVMRYVIELLVVCYIISHFMIRFIYSTVLFSPVFVIASVIAICLLLLGLRNLHKSEKTEEEESVCYHIRFFDLTFSTRFYLEDTIEKKDTIEMVFIQGGTFSMGSNDGESNEKPVHSVTLSSFYMSKYEVTQKQWREVMGQDPPELAFKGCDQCPVERVSWNDIQEFLQKLNAKTGKSYRLPTEAEWEYAARGGQSYKYAGSDNIDNVAWYTSNSGSKTHPVGQKSPNGYGLYDMSGNVWEWCSDWYGSYSSGAVTNPKGPSTGSNRVLRGGSWDYDADYCRSALRSDINPDYWYGNCGFRLAL